MMFVQFFISIRFWLRFTYDFESENDGAVTVRDRDTMEQVRVKIEELEAYFADKFTF